MLRRRTRESDEYQRKELLQRDLKLLPALALPYLLLFLGCSIFWLLLCFVCFFVFIDRGGTY
jgi:hypothetical protein